MKRLLVSALLAAWTTGSAAVGLAASRRDFSGFYRAYFVSDHDTQSRGEPGMTDNYLAHRLQLDFDFQATEAVSVHWRLWAPDFTRWGYRSTLGVDTRYAYGQIDQQWGHLALGRLMDQADQFGLSSLGWAPTLDPRGVFTSIAPFEDGQPNDGVRLWSGRGQGPGFNASYVKLLTNIPEDEGHSSSDQDWDRFQLEGLYQWDGGGAALNLIFECDATPNPRYDPWLTEAASRLDKTKFWYLNPALTQAWGPLSLHFEGKFGWARSKYIDYPDPDLKLEDLDSHGQWVYLDLDYNYGPGRVNLAGWWVSGTKMGREDSRSLVDMGANFYPLVVAFNDYTLGRGRIDQGYGDWQARGSALASANIYTNLVQDGWNRNYFLNPAVGSRLAGTDLAAGPSAATALIGFKSNASQGQGDNIQTNQHNEQRPRSNHWGAALSGQHHFS